MSGIYIHIPFCKQACSYCDFHFSTRLNNREDVIKAIVSEIALKKKYLKDKNLASIYFGGGTPSILTQKEVDLIFEELKRHFSFNSSIEITLEANPDDVNIKSLKEWKNLGINRLSIGLQSFIEEELRWMNRAHTASESVKSVKMAQDAGFENITIDLIYGSKFQTISSWEKTLKHAAELQTKHISSYNLTIENKTRLGTLHHKGNEPAISDELSSSQFLLMLDVFEQTGFIQYEISNFGKPGFFAKHNSNYWLGKHYMGVGPSAHSFNGISRQWNIKNNFKYVEKINKGESFFETENLSVNEKYNEYILTRLRTIWGCDIKEMESLFGAETIKCFLKEIELKKDFVLRKGDIFTLTKSGKLQADGIAADLFLT